jgi:peptidoglycan/xylan/chitin deacetylase (PgdA/CDA1 family)
MHYKTKLAVAVILAALAIAYVIYPRTGVPILAYHQINDVPEIYSVSPAEFDRQLRYLQEQGYTTISLAEMTAAFAGQAQLPAKPIVITFDDGYQDNYTTALPILRKYNMKATVFVIAGSVGQAEYLTWDEIAAMQAQNTEIGAHTLNHLNLSELPLDQQVHEVTASRQILTQHLGSAVDFMAYPFGKYDSALLSKLDEAGYRGACAGRPGLNVPGSNPYTLKRVNVPHPKFGLWEFKLRLLRARIYTAFGIN